MKISIALTLTLFFLTAGSSFAQTKNTPKETHKEVVPITATQVPFFFPLGIKTTSDPIEQHQEYERYLTSTWYCNQGRDNDSRAFTLGSDNVTVQTNVVSTSSVTENPAKMKIVLDHFVRQADGRVRVTTLCNQFFITGEQEQLVEKQLTALVEQAAKEDNDYYQVIMNLAIKSRAQKLGIDPVQFEKSLDEPMLDNAHVTYREFNRIPKQSKASDFVPRELHLGFNIPLGGILGVTWLNTGVIYYNPDAWIVDYLTGRPKVMAHEMVHVNINTEKFPMSEAFDAELLASIPEMLWPEDKVDLPTHGYAADLREIFQIYFNFDFEEMNKQIYKVDLAGNHVIDEVKYRMYYEQLEQIKAEALNFFQTVTIPEFYSDTAWWYSVNDIRGDNNSVFRMTLAQHYNPTILGSSKVSLDWAESHRELIMEIAEKAFRAGLGGQSNNSNVEDIHISPYLRNMYEKMFAIDERYQIESYYRTHPAELRKIKNMNFEELLNLAKQLKSQLNGGVN